MNNVQQSSKRWLPLGWKVMAGWGWLNIIFAVIVPLVTLLVSPTMMTYGSDDAKFTGASWDKIVALSPELGFWIGLTMIAMCMMMMAYGILQVKVSKIPYRRGERWAWRALLWSNLLYFIYGAGLTFTFFSRGIYGSFTSGISVGLPFLVVWVLVLIFGLWLPRLELNQ